MKRWRVDREALEGRMKHQPLESEFMDGPPHLGMPRLAMPYLDAGKPDRESVRPGPDRLRDDVVLPPRIGKSLGLQPASRHGNEGFREAGRIHRLQPGVDVL